MRRSRLAEKSVLVLTSLAGGPKHGYALIKDIHSFSGTKLGPGTLYTCLASLEEAGLIEALPQEDRRHPYRITELGLERLRQRLDNAAKVAQVGLARIDGTV